MLYPQSTVYLYIGLVIIEPMLCQRIVFVEILTQQTQNICIKFEQRRFNVFHVGPTLYKCYTNVSCLVGNLTHHISHEVVPPVGRGQPVNSPVANNVSTVSTPLTTVDHRSTPHVNKQHLKSLTLHKHICPHKGLRFLIKDLLCIWY